MKVLITGFERYHRVKINSSQFVLKPIEEKNQQYNITTRILSTQFDKAQEQISQYIRSDTYDVVISLGMSAQATTIQLERFAVNLKDSFVADNAGDIPEEEVLQTDSPTAYQVNTALRPLQSFLRRQGLPVTISNTAGTYVCNAVMFRALDTIARERIATKYFFVHIPALPTEVAQQEWDLAKGASMHVDIIVEGVLQILNWLKETHVSN
jgi:pyroglutamyl-peptidase